ncbi:gcy-12, partial [Symbiodinium sp. CCMP2456]
ALLSLLKHMLGILIYCSYGILLRIIRQNTPDPSWICERFPLLGISFNILPLALFTEFCYWMTKAQTLFLPGFLGVFITAFVLILLGYQKVFDTEGLLNYLNVISLFNSFRIYSMEYTLRQRYIAMHRVEVMQERIEGILGTLMPPLVIEEIKRLAHYVSHQYKHATIAQSDLCGFTALASTREPEEVVKFISQIFDLFDDLADRYDIYKVETVGDAYIAGQADFPLTVDNKPLHVVLFGLQMTMATRAWSVQCGENISCRVGVHTGECVGGM